MSARSETSLRLKAVNSTKQLNLKQYSWKLLHILPISTATLARTLVVGTALLSISASLQAGNVTGNLEKWAPLDVDFSGPAASETDNNPNPFVDYRLNVRFTSPSGNAYLVPGFFAGDGQGGGSGTIWRARFAADEVGIWQYEAIMRSGANVAVDTAENSGNAVALSDATGEFRIQAQSQDAPGFLRHGRLEYTGEHYLKFRDGPYWIKSGTDSPENFLGFAGIDGTVDHGGSEFLHDYLSHRSDARDDDPFFSNAATGINSAGITGALNYLSEQGVNSIYFLPMNLGGDGQETFPFVGGTKTSYNKTHYDISKLYQWNMVLNHAQRRGIALNIQLSETEPGNERWLDDGQMGTERKLFFRELIARFGYLLAAKWNLGEENDYPVSQLREQAAYLAELDWTSKPIAVHTQINNFRDYEQLVGDELFSASSIQYDPPLASGFVETWRQRSAAAGRKWVIDMDENTGGVSKTNADTRRKQLLYDVYFSGGNLEWYFGYHPLPLGGDITAGDFRQREATWQTMRYAREFMESELPFWRMEPADDLVSGEASSFEGAEVFAAENEVYAVYLPNASGNARLDLSKASGSFSLRWFNPRTGEFQGETGVLDGGAPVNLGSAPASINEDWVALVKSHNAPALPDFSVNDAVADATDNVGTSTNTTENDNPATIVTPEVSATNTPPIFKDIGDIPLAVPGSLFTLSVASYDADGVAPVVTAETLPAGMQIERVIDGVADIEWQVPTDAAPVDIELLAIDVSDRSMVAKLTINIEIETTASVDTPTTNIEPDSNTGDATTSPPVTNEPVVQVGNDVSGNTPVASYDELAVPPPPLITAGEDYAPSIVGADDDVLVVGTTYRKTIVPIDPEGIVASLRISKLPGDSTFYDNGNGSRDFVWTPTSDDIGEHEVRFIATDSGATPHVVQETVKLNVVDNRDSVPEVQDESRNYPPVFAPLTPKDVVVGDTISFAVNPIDPDGIPPVLHVKSPPMGATFTDNGNGTRTFAWEAMEAYTGEIELLFIATDSEDIEMSVEQTVTVNVLPR